MLIISQYESTGPTSNDEISFLIVFAGQILVSADIIHCSRDHHRHSNQRASHQAHKGINISHSFITLSLSLTVLSSLHSR